jgi:hypothetical protein
MYDSTCDSMGCDGEMIKKIRAIIRRHRITNLLNNLFFFLKPCRTPGEVVLAILTLTPWFLLGTYVLGYTLLYYKGTPEAFSHWEHIPSQLLGYALSKVALIK